MTSDNDHDPLSPGVPKPATESSTIASRVSKLSRQPPPTPPGRGVALALLAVAVLVAVVIQFTTDWGAGTSVRESAEDQVRKPPVAPVAPEAPGATNPEDPSEPSEPPRMPVATPGERIELPAGLSEKTAMRLRFAVAGVDEKGHLRSLGPEDARMMAVSSVKDLATLVEEAPEEERATLRPFVAERLASLAGREELFAWALDSGVRLATAGPEGLGPLVEAAREVGLRDDAAAGAAFAFLEALPAAEREASSKAILAIAKDESRPLHLRVQAARTLTTWGTAEAERKALAEAPDTPATLRGALR